MRYLFFCLSFFSCHKLTEHKKPVDPAKPKHYRISIIGDSISSDDPGNISMTGNTSSRSYGWHLKQMLDTTTYEFRNHAVSGVGVNEMRSQAQTIINEKDKSKINIVVILGCVNNITFNNMSGSECYRQMSDIHTTLRNKGFKTICIAITSRRQLEYFSEEQSQYFWSQITAADSLFKKNQASFCDHYLDLQSVDGFAGYEAATTSSYFLDGCHLSDAGRHQVAILLKEFVTKIK